MDELAVWLGPDVVSQLDIPLTPTITHLPAPEGATAPDEPVTVAVKVIAVPSVADGDAAETAIVGVIALTEVEKPEVGDVPK